MYLYKQKKINNTIYCYQLLLAIFNIKSPKFYEFMDRLKLVLQVLHVFLPGMIYLFISHPVSSIVLSLYIEKCRYMH